MPLNSALLRIVLTVGILASGPVFSQGPDKFIRIATGGFTGVYYAIGTSICRVINVHEGQKPTSERKRCVVIPTDGTPQNLEMLGTHADFAIGQSDIVFATPSTDDENQLARSQAGDVFKPKRLQALYALHQEKFVVIVKRDPFEQGGEDETGQISALEAFKDKRVFVGSERSGHFYTFKSITEKLGNHPKQNVHTTSDDYSLGDRLCQSNLVPSTLHLDTIIYVIGTPSDPINEILADCDGATILPAPDLVEGENWEKIKDNASQAKINPEAFGLDNFLGQSGSIPTFAVEAMLITADNVALEKVTLVCDAIRANITEFTKAHPSLDSMDLASLEDGIKRLSLRFPEMGLPCQK